MNILPELLQLVLVFHFNTNPKRLWFEDSRLYSKHLLDNLGFL